MQYADEYLIGVQLFNRGDYFEAHEAWEDIWRATADAQRDFYQGLIQVAVALCHYFNGNATGAHRLYDRSMAYLAPYGPTTLGLDLNCFRAALAKCFAPVLNPQPGDAVVLDPTRVPQIVLDPPPDSWPVIPTAFDS